jgi:hypothetical protein
MAHRWFWRWRVQRLFGLLLSWRQNGPPLLGCGHCHVAFVATVVATPTIGVAKRESVAARVTGSCVRNLCGSAPVRRQTPVMRCRRQHCACAAAVGGCCCVVPMARVFSSGGDAVVVPQTGIPRAGPRRPRHARGSQGAGPTVRSEGVLPSEARYLLARRDLGTEVVHRGLLGRPPSKWRKSSLGASSAASSASNSSDLVWEVWSRPSAPVFVLGPLLS